MIQQNEISWKKMFDSVSISEFTNTEYYILLPKVRLLNFVRGFFFLFCWPCIPV